MANQITTAVATGANYNVLSDLIRTVYAKEIEFHAQPALRFDQFAAVKTELGVNPGLTVTMVTYDNLTEGGAINEDADLESQYMNTSTVSITVGEYGNAVGVSELLLRTSFDDVLSSASRLLGNDYAKVVDGLLRTAALTGTNIKYGYSSGAAAADRGSITASHLFNTDLVKDGVEVLATNDAPYIAGGGYVCLVHPHQARNLRDDGAWINASNYGDPTALFRGEIGRYENVRFIETTQMPILTGAGSGSTDVYRGVMLGLDAYGWAIALPVEMRDDGVQNYGRRHSIAWYNIMGAGKLHNGRMVTLETA